MHDISTFDHVLCRYAFRAASGTIRNDRCSAGLRLEICRGIIIFMGGIHKHISGRVNRGKLPGAVRAPDADDILWQVTDLLFIQPDKDDGVGIVQQLGQLDKIVLPLRTKA